MNTPLQNHEPYPNIRDFRTSICHILISTGLKDSREIVNAAQEIEAYVFGEKNQADKTTAPNIKNANPEKQEVKTTEPKAETAPVDTKEAETQVEAESKFTFDEIKAALLRVAKTGRENLQRILDIFKVSNITQIPVMEYDRVMAEVEQFEAQNA